MEERVEFDSAIYTVCKTLYDKKAEDIKILQVGKSIPQITDFFIIATANSKEHMNALREHIEGELAKEKVFPHHVEGRRNSRWILLDYNYFIVHIMLQEAREFYRLEDIWGDVPRWSYDGDFKRED